MPAPEPRPSSSRARPPAPRPSAGRRAIVLGVLGAALVLGIAWRVLEALTPVEAPPARKPAGVEHTHVPTGHHPETVSAEIPPEPAEIARGVRGTVRAARGGPVAGAEIALHLVHADGLDGTGVDADGRRALGTVQSGASGRFALDADLAEWADVQGVRGVRLVAEVRASGHQPHRAERVLADLVARAAGKTLVELDLVLDPGQTLRGRVVGEDGKPRPGAAVELVIPTRRAGELAERVATHTEAARDGRFALGFLSGGLHTLRVRADGVGTALLADLDLQAGHDRELGDVVVHGPGVLAGVAVQSDGSPAAFIDLWAVPAELAFDAQTAERGVARRAVLDLEGREGDDGFRLARLTTDADGRFRAAGLRDGRYALVLPHGARSLEPAGAAWATPAETIRVVVPGTRIVVRVVDADGHPATGARVACARAEPDAEGGYALSAHRSQAARGAAAACAFDVDPRAADGAGARYALRALRGASSVEELVEIAPGTASHAVTLVLPDERPGQLRMALAGPRGETVRRARVSLASKRLGAPLDGFTEREVDGQGLLAGVPAGTYAIAVAAVTDDDDDLLLLPETVRAEIEIRPGATAEFARVLPAGAGVTLTLELDGPPPPGFELAIDPQAHPDAAARDRAVHEAARGAAVHLRSAAGAPRALAFVVPPVPPQRVAGVAGTLLPGRTARVQGALPPGEYVLHVEAPGFAPAEAPLVLRAGERAELHVTLRQP